MAAQPSVWWAVLLSTHALNRAFPQGDKGRQLGYTVCSGR